MNRISLRCENQGLPITSRPKDCWASRPLEWSVFLRGGGGPPSGGTDTSAMKRRRLFPRRLSSRRRSWREAVTDHNLRHLLPVRRPAGRRVDHLGGFTKILRTNCGRRDHAEPFRVLAAVVVEPVNGAARNAERLPGLDFELFSVDRKCQHSVDDVDRLFVMVVAMRWRCQTLPGRNSALKNRDAAARVLSGDQEADRDRPEADGLVGRIDLEIQGLSCHLVPVVHACYRHACAGRSNSKPYLGAVFSARPITA